MSNGSNTKEGAFVLVWTEGITLAEWCESRWQEKYQGVMMNVKTM